MVQLLAFMPHDNQLSIMRGIRVEAQAIYVPNLLCLLAWLGLLVAERFWKRRRDFLLYQRRDFHRLHSGGSRRYS